MTMDGVEAAVEVALPADEAKEEAAKATPSAEGGDDLRSEMINFLKSEEAGEENPESAKATAPEEAKEGASDDEPEEVEAKTDESEDEEVEAKSGDEPEKPKKQSGWQKSKKKLEEAKAKIEASERKVAEFTERESKWEHVTSLFQGRLEEAEARNARLEARLEELGAGPDPRDNQVEDLSRRLREQQAEIDRREREFEARQQQAEQRQQEQRITAIKAEVARVAEANGLDPDVLAARAASAANTARYLKQPPPSLADVAEELALLRRNKTGSATQRQAEVSQSAPRSVRGTAPSPTAPSFEPNTAGALALLRSEGLL